MDHRKPLVLSNADPRNYDFVCQTSLLLGRGFVRVWSQCLVASAAEKEDLQRTDNLGRAEGQSEMSEG